MPFCRKCGNKMNAKTKYCSKCGFDNQAQTLVPGKLEFDVGPRVGEKIFPQILKTWWFITLIIVIAFIIMAFLMFLAFNNAFTNFPIA